MAADIPFSPPDLLLGALVCALALFVGWAHARRSDEPGTYFAALAIKLVACVAYNAVYFYYYEGEGDSIDRYHVEGVEYAERLRSGDLPDDEALPPVLDVLTPATNSTE